ncbi:hypothetical protein GGI23_004740, partial [Coemansia sp. RSA 2559]
MLTLHPLEQAVPDLSIDTKLDDAKLHSSKAVLTSEAVEIEAPYEDTLSPTGTLVDRLPPSEQIYPIQVIDVNKHRIMHLQRYKHVLRLVILCTTACWASLTVAFTLLIIHQIATNGNGRGSGTRPNYTLIFALVVVAVS